MKERFGCPVGFSDHSLGIGASVCSVAFGACMIEKHLTLSRKTESPDSFFSTEPQELKELVDNIRIAEQALGEVNYGLTEDEKKSIIFRRSLFVVEDVLAGDKVTQQNVRSIRPGHGMEPRYFSEIQGWIFKRDVSRGTPLDWDMI